MKLISQWQILASLFSLSKSNASVVCSKLTPLEWQSLAEFSVSQLVAPEFFQRLVNIDGIRHLPSHIAEALEGSWELNELLHDDLYIVFRDFLSVANRLDISPTLLKGGIDILSPADAINSSRVASDLDILVDPNEGQELYFSLLSAGFHPDKGQNDSDFVRYALYHHHYPPLWHPEINQYIELHTKLCVSDRSEEMTRNLIDLTEKRKLLEYDFKVPSIESRLKHNAFHHSVNTSLKLKKPDSFRQFLDFYRLSELCVTQLKKDIESLSSDPLVLSALRINASITDSLFASSLIKTELTHRERLQRFIFWKCLDSHLFFQGYKFHLNCIRVTKVHKILKELGFKKFCREFLSRLKLPNY